MWFLNIRCRSASTCCSVHLPEAVGDGGILFYIHRKIQKVLIFAAYLKRNKDIKKVSLINLEYY